MHRSPLFDNRSDAGRRLAAKLAARARPDVIVYGLPRGGTPVAFEIAQALKAPLDLVLVRKIGAPGNPEVALAAVVDGEHPRLIVNQAVLRMTGAGASYLAREQALMVAEIERRRQLYFAGQTRPSPKGRPVIIADDGLATGATARAAIEALRAEGAGPLTMATPVASPEAAAAIRSQVDEFVCLAEPSDFGSVGAYYRDFHQLDDEEVLDLLSRAAPSKG